MRETILIEGAREHNLQNIKVEIPRNKLVVITGVSGSGKSSLAFDTLFAEAQRRLMESMSSYAKRFVNQMKKPDVDFMSGLSPVISIDQKTISKNPRSTVGTMTDISDYLRMLFATLGKPHCPLCDEQVPVFSPYRMMEHMLSLPDGTEVEVRAPVLPIFGEDMEYLFEDIRTKGYRRVRLDGVLTDIGDDVELEDEAVKVEVVVDRFVVRRGIDKDVLAGLQHGLKIGEGFLSFHILDDDVDEKARKNFQRDFGCAQHGNVAGSMHHGSFTFNDASGACVTCSGLGDYLHVHPDLLIPDKTRSLGDGAIVKEAFGNDKNSWGGRILHSLASHYDFALDTPFGELPERIVQIILRGTKGEKFKVVIPEGASQGHQHEGKEIPFDGVITGLENRYKWYRKRGVASGGMEDYLRKVMVEYACPDCEGARLKRQRLMVTINDLNLYQLGELHLKELRAFLDEVALPEKDRAAGEAILREIVNRLDLLINIGLDYLNLNRRSATLSGGESQRIRLSSQIGSGLMGMLYVLDEPSIGLHPKDNVKMIRTLKQLRDIGNSVIVVEHDEETMAAADFIVEMGPGPGVHGGQVVVAGDVKQVIAHKRSLTGAFLSGRRSIPLPAKRRDGEGKQMVIRGARENNLTGIDVPIPLRRLVCITGASGSGKSSLIHEILYKKLYSLIQDSRVLAGKHSALEGWQQVDDVIHVDQSPIGRSPRSNPATYIGFYDHIRKLFAATDLSKQRGYKASRFSFNVKGGRCEECGGEGTIITRLAFMPDVEAPCPSCKGARYNGDTLEVTYRDKHIAQVLDMSIEEGVDFFEGNRLIQHKLRVLHELGLGYLAIGHPSTILSGGEAQRVKLASELGKMKRGKHNLYILDEPTTGLHTADIQRLLDCLNRLIDGGHSVIVIEHNLDVIKCADHIIDLGPEGGHKGGRIMAVGTPEEVAATQPSHTGKFLAEKLA